MRYRSTLADWPPTCGCFQTWRVAPNSHTYYVSKPAGYASSGKQHSRSFWPSVQQAITEKDVGRVAAGAVRKRFFVVSTTRPYTTPASEKYRAARSIYRLKTGGPIPRRRFLRLSIGTLLAQQSWLQYLDCGCIHFSVWCCMGRISRPFEEPGNQRPAAGEMFGNDRQRAADVNTGMEDVDAPLSWYQRTLQRRIRPGFVRRLDYRTSISARRGDCRIDDSSAKRLPGNHRNT